MPNGEDKKVNFVLKIFDNKTKQWRPIYVPPDATDKVQGDVKLSDATDSTLDALEGMTAATPKAVKEVNDNANSKLSKIELESQTVKSEVVFESLVTGKNGFKGNLNGNAATASALTPGRSINVKSGADGSPGAAKFTGESDITITIPTLDATTLKGLVPLASIPQGALENLIKVANEEARFQLTTENVQLGDSVLQIDTGVMYIVVDESKLSSAQGYQEYKAATALKAEEASKLGTDTIGSNIQPIFLENGVPVVVQNVGLKYGGTGANDIPTAANNLKYSSIGLRKILSEVTSLNDMKSIGSYFCPKELEPQITEKPLDNKNNSFSLDVISNVCGNENYLRQELRYSDSSEVWERLFLISTETDTFYPERDEFGWTKWILTSSNAMFWNSI